jgi:hypothetical protein
MSASKNSARDNGLKAFYSVKKVLIDTGWDPEPTGAEGILTVDFTGDKIPIKNALADVRVDLERFIFYLNFSDKVPKKTLVQTMEFVTRANMDLVIGNFELNLDARTIRFKGSLDFTGAILTEPLIRDLIKSSMDAVEYFSDTLMTVVKGNKNALEALKELG